MKTTHDLEKIHLFLIAEKNARPDSVHPLVEGQVAQAFAFTSDDGTKKVLRIAMTDTDFLCDEYAFNTFGSKLPIPQVYEIGKFDTTSFFCISAFVPGSPTNVLEQADIDRMQPAILNTYATLFTIDVSSSGGFGPLDVVTGNGRFSVWNAWLAEELDDFNPARFRDSASNIGLDSDIADKFMEHTKKRLRFVPEIRGLIHGDLGFDNLIVRQDKPVALIDWANVGYGDWAYDFSKLNFRKPGRHGSMYAFAKTHGLGAKHLEQREIFYCSVIALRTIRFADRFKNQTVARWLQDNLPDKLIVTTQQ